jgi:CheY-like chemotaxis protein
MTLRPKPLRCVFIDDSPHYIAAAAAVLECTGVEVLALITDARTALSRIGHLRPDVILIDVHREEDGFELAAQLHRHAGFGAPPALVMMSVRDTNDFTDILAGSPARGFIGKAALSGPALRALLREGRGATGQPAAQGHYPLAPVRP